MTYPVNPALECDIVMKGGITSGVIYPRVVCELAKSYRLRSVGGSSAGAIAAAGAAAAELGRTAGGFELLEALPARHHRRVAGRRIDAVPAVPADQAGLSAVPGVHLRNG